jgi:hypothetical protein
MDEQTRKNLLKQANKEVERQKLHLAESGIVRQGGKPTKEQQVEIMGNYFDVDWDGLVDESGKVAIGALRQQDELNAAPASAKAAMILAASTSMLHGYMLGMVYQRLLTAHEQKVQDGGRTGE